METNQTKWTKEDLLVYTLIYCANADYVESNFEINHIKSKIVNSDYNKLKAEFEKDNPHQSLCKIKDAFDAHGYTSEEKELFFDDVRSLFIADGRYSHDEQELFKILNNIIDYRF